MHRDWSDQKIEERSDWRAFLLLSSDFQDSCSSIIKDPDRLISEADLVLKDDATTTVAKVNQHNLCLVIKRYNARNRWHSMKRALRRSRARRCWQMSFAFRAAGLNVARPIAMHEKRFGPIRRNAYFINLFLQGEELLQALPRMTGPQQVEVVSAVQQAFAIMRRHKLSHGDLKASNLLWSEGKLFFVDLDASRQHRTYTGWRLAHQKDIRRFLKNWRDNGELMSLFEGLPD